MNDLGRFTQAFIEALYFTDTGDVDQPDSDAELEPESLLDIQAECRSFWRRFGCYVVTDVCREAFDDPVIQAGHDFHMTRNGHGVGFWEEEWPECYRDLLTKGAKGYGEVWLAEQENGLLYWG